MGVIDLSTFKPVPSTLGDANQVANGFQAIQTLLNGNVDNNNFGAGKIFDLTKFMQGGAAIGDALIWDGANWAKQSAIAAPAAQQYVDSGSTDFFSSGLWLVEVDLGNLVGGALVYMGNNTATGTRHIVVLASGANANGIIPTFTAVNQDTNTGVLRVSSAAASGATVTVRYRHITKTI